MNDDFAAVRPDQMPWTNVVLFHGDAFLGNRFNRASMRPVNSSASRILDRDQKPRASSTLKNFFGQTSVTIANTIVRQTKSLTVKRSHEAKDKIPNPLNGFRDTL